MNEFNQRCIPDFLESIKVENFVAIETLEELKIKA